MDRPNEADYRKQLLAMNNEELGKECESQIWLSAYASNNPRAQSHWMVDCCYDETKRREKVEIYSQAHRRASAGAR